MIFIIIIYLFIHYLLFIYIKTPRHRYGLSLWLGSAIYYDFVFLSFKIKTFSLFIDIQKSKLLKELIQHFWLRISF
jgi:hypothetical protein